MDAKKNSKYAAETSTFRLAVGEINLARMVAEKENDGIKTEYKIMRTVNNNRQRPDAEKRHEDQDDQNKFQDKF